MAEALLLARWLRSAGWLGATDGLSSADEQPDYVKFNAAVRQPQWRMRLGVLAGKKSRKPGVSELLAASECVMLTSAQEGFGLPYLEAAAGRPAAHYAFPAEQRARFAHLWPALSSQHRKVLVATSSFDWPRERSRQLAHFRPRQRLLPVGLRQQAKRPDWLVTHRQPHAVPLSRLTGTAQPGVLTVPVEQSWSACLPLNPFLATWVQRGPRGRLQVTRWPQFADQWLSGPAYATRFAKLLRTQPSSGRSKPGAEDLPEEFLARTLATANQYPLL